MSETKYPSQFQLASHTVKIVKDNNKCDLERVYGTVDYPTKTITYQDETSGKKITESAVEVIIRHEVIHLFLDTIGYNDLSQDEKLVKGLSELMYQFETTLK